MFKNYFFGKAAAQQLGLFALASLRKPALLKAQNAAPLWTAPELLETSLPPRFDCCGDRFLICNSQILKLDFNRDVMQSIINEVVTSIFFSKGPSDVLSFFDSLQPMLMENLYCEGFSLSLEDFVVSKEVLRSIQTQLQDISPLLYHLRSNSNDLVELQLDKHMRVVKLPISNFILNLSSMGNLIDSKSDSAINRIVQQVGFLGLQLSDKGKLYSRTLVGDMASLFHSNYPFAAKYPSEEFGLVRRCLFHGLDPYQEMVHSISSREVMVRSSRGLTEPGTLFKSLMAILRDVVICYDGTVRNVCSNSIIQFDYGVKTQSLFAAGEPVGVLAATAISNPAYKAVLDSSPSSNSSWEMMKEILLCRVNFKNDLIDRRVILYLNDCNCGRKYCREKAAYLVKNHLKKVSLRDAAVKFLIEYRRQQVTYGSSEIDAGLVGHVHLNKMLLNELNISMEEVLEKCQDTMNSFRKKKKVGHIFKRIALSFGECSFHQSCESQWLPCLKFFWQDTTDLQLERTSHIFADTVCPVLLETIIKGDPRVREAKIIWISPETMTWIQNPREDKKGELALDVVLEKEAVKRSGDAWRTVLDSCLPVIHLIDTRRSIPYAIKQVQELLGISCAFEQAVQRLSTSVSMVTKGVLKEHLILLANSMTCAGNLVGFNTGGVKALSRILNVQVPFTEATLYTPKKCFERAAEKCHADSLSSIVASCSWGKHVAVGTGSRFDILWDTREVQLNQKHGIDVYNFLHLVQISSEEVLDGCLGDEADSFDMEIGSSPEHNSSFEKPVFEDSAEFNVDVETQKEEGSKTSELNWERVSDANTQSSGGWDQVFNKTQIMESDTVKPRSSGWSHDESPRSSGWVGSESEKHNNQQGSWTSWGKKVVQPEKPVFEDSAEFNVDVETQKVEGSKTSELNWERLSAANIQSSGGWNQVFNKSQIMEADTVKLNSSGWSHDESPRRGSESEKHDNQPGSGASWGKKVVQADGIGRNKNDRPLLDRNVNSEGWVERESEEDDKFGSVPSPWGKKVGSGDRSGWNAKDDQNKWAVERNVKASVPDPKLNGWGKEKSSSSRGWGPMESKKDDDQPADRSGWNAKDDQAKWPVERNAEASVAEPKPSAWGAKESSSKSRGWGPVESKKDDDQPADRSGWNVKDDNAKWPVVRNAEDSIAEPKPSAWGGKENSSKSRGWGPMEPKKDDDQSVALASWGRKVEKGDETGWNGKRSQSMPDRTECVTDEPTWKDDSQLQPESNETAWKKESLGSSNAREWKNKKDRPARPIGGSNDGPRAGAPFTATRQRLDIFTSEEQDILLEIEPIMQSIRRIMHQTGYNDGDPLSADDQSYILDHVFKYHPDKVQKMGAGVDYVMVNKHSNFQESRCFYIVSTDGRKEDFSYRKCLENFIREKYPDQVKLFISKYFKKPQPRPGWNRERSSGPDEDGTPRSGWNRERSSGPDEAATPRSRWYRERSSGPDEVGTPRSGWNRERSTVPDEAGTPHSGWHRESSIAPEETGTPQSSWDGGSSVAPDEAGTPRSGWGT